MTQLRTKLRRWVIDPVIKQLKQGSSPERISWAVTLGIVLGIFPIMGTTSAICFLFGWLFKLNQPILHLFKTLCYPFHLALILLFIRLGQKLHGAPPLTLSIPQMLKRFQESPSQFAADFGIAALYGIEAWAITCLFLIPLIYFVSLPLIKRLSSQIAKKRMQTAT